MQEKQDLELLLTNIQRGLKIYSVQELNSALSKILTQKQDKQKEVNIALSIVCAEYRITRETLMKKNGRGELADAKDIAYCLLHFGLDLRVRHIAKKIFFNWPNSVSKGVKRLKTINPKIKQDQAFLDTYKKLQERFITQLSIESNQNPITDVN